MATGRDSERPTAVPASTIAAAMVHRIAYLSDKRRLGGRVWRLDGTRARATDAFGQLVFVAGIGPRRQPGHEVPFVADAHKQEAGDDHRNGVHRPSCADPESP